MNAIVTKLLAKDPEDRYADADELANDLRRVNRGLEPAAAGVGSKQGQGTRPTALTSPDVTNKMQRARPGPMPYRRRRRLPWVLIVLAVILFTLGALGGVQAILGPDAMMGWFDVFQGDKRSPGQPSGPEQVNVPEVAGLTRSVAEKRLIDAGLEVGQITSFPSDSVAAGRVIAPGIAAGTPVDLGTEVNLTISSGPQPASSASPSASACPEPGPADSVRPSATRPSPPGARIARLSRRQRPGQRPRTTAQGVQKSPPAQPNGQNQWAAPADSGPGENSGGRRRRGSRYARRRQHAERSGLRN